MIIGVLNGALCVSRAFVTVTVTSTNATVTNFTGFGAFVTVTVTVTNVTVAYFIGFGAFVTVTVTVTNVTATVTLIGGACYYDYCYCYWY